MLYFFQHLPPIILPLNQNIIVLMNNLSCFILSIIFLGSECKISAQNSRGAVPVSEEQGSGSTYSIIIGISDYKNVPDLYYADRDALDFKEYLLSRKPDSTQSDNIELFLNQQASKINILDALSAVFKKIQKGDKLFFYFAGHGDIEDLTQSENGLLLLYGAPEKNYFGLTDEVLQINQLAEYFGKLQAQGADVIYIIDACHSGQLIGGTSGKIHTMNAIQNILSAESTLMLSSAGNQLALEGVEWGGGHGIFSHYLQQGLKGMADLDRDNNISFIELETYVKRNTFIESEKKQTPVFIGDPNRILNTITDDQWNLIKNQANQSYSEYSQINFKGKENTFLESCTEESKKLYVDFNQYLNSNLLIDSYPNNAISTCKRFIFLNPSNYLSTIIRRKLITKLNQSFDSIVRPIISCKKPKWSKDLLLKSKMELDSCLELIQERHYLYPHILSRKYYLEGLLSSYGININNYGPMYSDKMKECFKFFHLARQLEPNASYVYYSLGRSHQTILQTDSSLLYLEKFVTLLPNSALAHNMLGISYGDKNWFQRAANEFNKAIDLDIDFKDAYANIICMYSKLNFIDSAINIAQKGMTRYPSFIAIRNNLSELYMQVGKMQEAITIIDGSLHLDSLSMSSNELKGTYLFKIGKYAEAQSNFEKMLQRRPDHRMAFYYLGLCFKAQKQFIKAIINFKKQLNYDSTDFIFYLEIADCYKLLMDTLNLKHCLQKMETLINSPNEYSELIGDYYNLFLDNPALSEKYYLKAFQEDTFNLIILSKLCNLLIRENKYSEITKYLKIILHIPNSNSYIAYLNLSMKIWNGDFENAETEIEKIIRCEHELKWRIHKDPVFTKLMEKPEILTKLNIL